MSENMLPKFWIKFLWDCKFGSWACWTDATCRGSDTGGKRVERKGAESHREKTHTGQREKEVWIDVRYIFFKKNCSIQVLCPEKWGIP